MSDSNDKGVMIIIAFVILFASFGISFFIFTEYTIQPIESDFSETPHYKINTYDDTVTINLNDVYGEYYVEDANYMNLINWNEKIYPTLELVIQSRDFIKNGNLMDDDTITIKHQGRGYSIYKIEDVDETIPLLYNLNSIPKYNIPSSDIFKTIEMVKTDIHGEEIEDTINFEFNFGEGTYTIIEGNKMYVLENETNKILYEFQISKL